MGTPSLSGAIDSSVMYLLETAHSSFCSRRMAPTSRVMAASLGACAGEKVLEVRPGGTKSPWRKAFSTRHHQPKGSKIVDSSRDENGQTLG